MTDTTVSETPEQHRYKRPRGGRRWWLIALVLAAVGGGAYYKFGRKAEEPTGPGYLTEKVSKGAIEETVRATGTVQPLLEVTVGAQVSGRISAVHVDYNAKVKAGDLLAEIDAAPYEAQLAQARASLLSARAQRAQASANLALAEKNLARANELRAAALNAQSEVDQAVAARDAGRASVQVAEAQIAQANAGLSEAENRLTYTRILAPIDGIVSKRGVEPGQTVAASFQTPTLFVIANDLTRMRIIANVDEANIGKLKESMKAVARVEAYPRDTFDGTVTSLRITPITTNGVVSYESVIEVSNDDGRLRPGMTATVTVTTQKSDAVFRVPNAALRYKPSASAGEGGEKKGALGGSGKGFGATGKVFLLSAGEPAPQAVKVGITDGVMTEVEGSGLSEGAEVILEETDAAAGGAPGGPPGGKRGGGGPGRMRVF
jgi:HlyD family secretion protein